MERNFRFIQIVNGLVCIKTNVPAVGFTKRYNKSQPFKVAKIAYEFISTPLRAIVSRNLNPAARFLVTTESRFYKVDLRISPRWYPIPIADILRVARLFRSKRSLRFLTLERGHVADIKSGRRAATLRYREYIPILPNICISV